MTYTNQLTFAILHSAASEKLCTSIAVDSRLTP